MQDPGEILSQLDIALPCAMDEQKMAVLDKEHTSYVNHEVYFFSDLKAKAAFEKTPYEHCGIVTDPVSHERFRPNRGSPRFDHDGRPYFFLSDSTLTMFAAMPDSFAVGKTGMIDKSDPRLPKSEEAEESEEEGEA